MVENYLLTHHRTTLLRILKDTDVNKHYSINISFIELFDSDTNLGNNILKNCDEALNELNQQIIQVQHILLEQSKDEMLVQKLHVHARVYGLPACPELHRVIFPKNEDLNLFLQISGTIIRVTASKMLEYRRQYMCSKCKHVQMIDAVYEQRYSIIPTKRCSNSENCSGTSLLPVSDLNIANCKDYQEVKIQEQASKLGVGTMPCSMWVTLEDDLVDVCKPGDDVTICGTVKRRWGTFVPGKAMEVELVFKANHIQINNGHTSPGLITAEIRNNFTSFWNNYETRPLEGRNLILKSFCPKLYGMYMVKLAMAVVLAGGCRCTEGNEIGIQIRSAPHILLVGDPGTGKSQLLRYAAKVITRSVITTGVGTTSAGLTAAAMMEDGQWQLEGGALVLADGGICCIDEFSSMKAQDRTSIHEAMEQQTISVAKASMVCKLHTRCSIIAATNPKGGRLDASQPLSLNLTLPSPLLSRFDLVLMLKDYYKEEWDNLVADKILSEKGSNAVKTSTPLWNLEMLQQYFTIIRNINPVLLPEANKILSSYYQAQRQAVIRNKARTTVRLLDSLVRLSQAHARLMLHSEVQVMDAVFAVILIENSMHGECSVLLLDSINVQSPFNEAPMDDYAKIMTMVLSKLELHDILHKEGLFLSNGCKYNSDIPDAGEEPRINTHKIELLNSKDTEDNTESPLVSNKNDEPLKNNVSSEEEAPKQRKKFKFVNKQKSDIKEELVGKKRKTSDTSEFFRQPKLYKNKSNLNDCQMLKLIPSVNEEFDSTILDFTYTESAEENKQLLLNDCTTLNSSEDEKLNKQKNKNKSPCFGNRKIENNKEDDQVHFIANSVEIQNVENKDIAFKLSQNTKLRQFREKFSFKPRNSPEVVHSNDPTNTNNVCLYHNIIENSIEDSSIPMQTTETTQSLFRSKDEDYDSLDVDF